MFVIFWASPGESKFLGGLGSEGPLSLSETLFLFQNMFGALCVFFLDCSVNRWLPFVALRFGYCWKRKGKYNYQNIESSLVQILFGRPICLKYVWKVVAQINIKQISKRHAIIVIPRPSGPEKVP